MKDRLRPMGPLVAHRTEDRRPPPGRVARLMFTLELFGWTVWGAIIGSVGTYVNLRLIDRSNRKKGF